MALVLCRKMLGTRGWDNGVNHAWEDDRISVSRSFRSNSFLAYVFRSKYDVFPDAFFRFSWYASSYS